VILRDENGEPTGIVKDAAKDLVLRAIAKPSEARLDAALRQGIALGLSKGVTEVHVPELDWSTFENTRRLRAQGETGMRFYNFTPLKDWERQAAIVAQEGRGDDWVRWGGCKVVFDGSLGSRTALMYLPYLDEPHAHGIMVTDPKDLKAWMTGADKAGLQVTAHAIGDEANDIVLDTMAAVAKANGARDRRFRIEHAQHLREEAIGRFAKQGVIASMQPYHAIDDGRWAVRRVGPERLRTSFAVGSMVRSGAHVCFGSDWPVAPLDPLTGIYAAVMRETIDGLNPHGWYPEQRITMAQALRGYTREAAYAGRVERQRGAIMPGMQADFAVFDRDLFRIDPETIPRSGAAHRGGRQTALRVERNATTPLRHCERSEAIQGRAYRPGLPRGFALAMTNDAGSSAAQQRHGDRRHGQGEAQRGDGIFPSIAGQADDEPGKADEGDRRDRHQRVARHAARLRRAARGLRSHR
jgi:predicted amidohydrolase YtcJ